MIEDINPNPDFPPLTPDEIKEQKEMDKLKASSERLKPRIKKNPKTAKERKRVHEAVSGFLSEYLDSYMIIGYDTNEQELVVVNANSPLQYRALSHLLKQFMGNSITMFDSDDDGSDDD